MGHFVLECVLHRATLWDILYLGVLYCVTPCHIVGHFFFFLGGGGYSVCYTVPSCGTFCTGLCVTLCMEVLVPCV